MRRRFLISTLFLVIFGSGLTIPLPILADAPVTTQAFPYQSGFPRSEPHGTISFASPSVVDLNRDGKWEVLTADGAGCVWAWDHSGKVLPGFPWNTFGSCSGTPRIIGPLAIGDVDGDGSLEVAAGTRSAGDLPGQLGRIFVWRANGSVLPGWPKEMDWNLTYGDGEAEVHSVVMANVAGDAGLEILAGTSNNTAAGGVDNVDIPPNLYAWYAGGVSLPGYPTWSRTAGIYGQIGAADLTGDGYAEVITGRDHLYIHAYNATGQYLAGWPVRTYVDQTKDVWNVHPYMEFPNNAPAMGDLDGDGRVEVVIAGKVKDPNAGHVSVNSAVLVVEPDGKRRDGWQVAKLGGGPLGSFQPTQAPALADLNNDRKLEIVVALFDGTIRAYQENGNLLWTYDYAQGRPLYGSEPAIGDITGDGNLDIIFGTYSSDGSANSAASIIGLDANGQILPNFPLPLTREGNSDKQGVRAGPTLADIDGDCDVEILAASQAGILYAWDLPTPYYSSLMPWPTSRHDNLRSGAINGPLNSAISSGNVSASDSQHTIYLPLIFGGC